MDSSNILVKLFPKVMGPLLGLDAWKEKLSIENITSGLAIYTNWVVENIKY